MTDNTSDLNPTLGEGDSSPATVQKRPRILIPALIGLGTAAVLGSLGVMVARADAGRDHLALSSRPKPVSTIEATSAVYRGSRSYVGTIQPWQQADIGPQLVSAYVDKVLVRPGAVVKRGQVIATLDCRNANAASQSIAMQARAYESRQQAVEHEARRVQQLLDGGFVSPNEAEQKSAQSSAELAQLLATRARLLGSSLAVNDCVLRSPFDGEVATRLVDPGAFVHPGAAIVSVVDRTTVRVTADAPEVDFGLVSPSKHLAFTVPSTRKRYEATVSRRAPAADPESRTVRFEADVDDPERVIPVGTTAEITIESDTPVPATRIPLAAAVVNGEKARVFVVDGEVARSRTIPVVGESDGQLYLSPVLPAGARVITEGRALLADGDLVAATAGRTASTEASKTPLPQATP